MTVRQHIPRCVPAVLLAAVLIPSATVCRRAPAPAPPDPGPAAGYIRFTRGKLFEGNLSRIEPHLGLTATGCVRLDGAGTNFYLGIEPEVREAGKPGRPLGSSLTHVEEPSELSFSLREVTGPKGSGCTAWWPRRPARPAADLHAPLTSPCRSNRTTPRWAAPRI